MAELLFELFSEEIPARMQGRAASAIRGNIINKFKQYGVIYKNVSSYVTSRRLTVYVDHVDPIIKETITEKKGPNINAPESAILGFSAKVGKKISELEVREIGKDKFYFEVVKHSSVSVNELLTKLLIEIIEEFTWAKSMRWGDNTTRWVRPLKNILCIFDSEILPVKFDHLTASNVTFGHRFMAKQKVISVNSFSEYEAKLFENYVIIDANQRRQIIQDKIKQLAQKTSMQIWEDDELLDEAVGLVEWPVVLLGNIADSFMRLPKEVLITTMRTHQKYFALIKSDGNLAPYFIFVANIETEDNGKGIIIGNERVLAARFSDARFFYEQDLRHNLDFYIEKLSKVIFHTKLGTMYDKVERIASIASLFPGDQTQIKRAARLCKFDLVTSLVGELPELQGIVGSYYTSFFKEPREVVEAIRNHYKPIGKNDKVPTEQVSVAVAIADKIDSFVGLFLIGEKPTGSKDPFALKRAVFGVIRIILENKIRVSIREVLKNSIDLYKELLIINDDQAVLKELLEFLQERFKSLLSDSNIGYNLINAVLDKEEEYDLYNTWNKIYSLAYSIVNKNCKALLSVYKRAAQIVLIEEKKDSTHYIGEPQVALFRTDEEKILLDSIIKNRPIINQLMAVEDYVAVIEQLATLEKPINNFFDKVIVNDDDLVIRKNRLLILSNVRELISNIANFALIEG